MKNISLKYITYSWNLFVVPSWTQVSLIITTKLRYALPIYLMPQNKIRREYSISKNQDKTLTSWLWRAIEEDPYEEWYQELVNLIPTTWKSKASVSQSFLMQKNQLKGLECGWAEYITPEDIHRITIKKSFFFHRPLLFWSLARRHERLFSCSGIDPIIWNSLLGSDLCTSWWLNWNIL